MIPSSLLAWLVNHPGVELHLQHVAASSEWGAASFSAELIDGMHLLVRADMPTATEVLRELARWTEASNG